MSEQAAARRTRRRPRPVPRPPAPAPGLHVLVPAGAPQPGRRGDATAPEVTA